MYSFLKSVDDKIEINISYVNKIENLFNVRFPKVLIDYYMRYNNVKINLCIFTINQNEYEVVKIIPLKSKSNSFENIKRMELKFQYIPIDFMPLARNRGGDYYYWDKNENVYLIYSDRIDSPVKICDSIEAFFYLLENGRESLM